MIVADQLRPMLQSLLDAARPAGYAAMRIVPAQCIGSMSAKSMSIRSTRARLIASAKLMEEITIAWQHSKRSSTGQTSFAAIRIFRLVEWWPSGSRSAAR